MKKIRSLLYVSQMLYCFYLINSFISKFLIRPDAAVLFVSKLLFMPFIKISIRLIVILCKFAAYLVNCLY